jgi:hypothetical protein
VLVFEYPQRQLGLFRSSLVILKTADEAGFEVSPNFRLGVFQEKSTFAFA